MAMLGLLVLMAGAGDRTAAADTPEIRSMAGVVCDFDRWMYSFNATPGSRASASVFGTLNPESTSDSRSGQFLLGWTTSESIPAGLAPTRYRVIRARVTLTINRDQAWRYDGTSDPFESHLPEGDPRRVADPDAGRPVELFGAGFRNGFTAETFAEDGPYISGGEGSVGTRNAFAAGFLPDGSLVDVSNNVGKPSPEPFPVDPFAVGTIDGFPAGDPVPTGTPLRFDIDSANPAIHGFLVAALREGRLRLVATSLQPGNFTGAPTFPQFHTRESVLATDAEKPRLDLEVEILPDEGPALGIHRGESGVVLTFTPAPPGGVVIEESADLRVWERRTVTPTAGPDGSATWTPGSADNTRFYRLAD